MNTSHLVAKMGTMKNEDTTERHLPSTPYVAGPSFSDVAVGRSDASCSDIDRAPVTAAPALPLRSA
jgi:hypothetical protein